MELCVSQLPPGPRQATSPASLARKLNLPGVALPANGLCSTPLPIFAFKLKQPPNSGRKTEPANSPIRDLILTGAEVDQILGLLLLREFHSFRVHATPSVRRILTEDNSMFGVLARFAGQVCWHDLPLDRPFSAGGARLEVLPLPAPFPDL